MMVSLIVAYSKNRAIGLDNKMLWRLSDDFKNYKKITMGHCLLMGRKTFESIGKPLPGRTSIVITRNRDYIVPEGVHITHSLEQAIDLAKNLGETECFINGGGEIYRQSLPLVERVYVTDVDCVISKADAYFPDVDFSKWRKTSGFDFIKDDKNQYDWSFSIFEKV
jgi:dihydrofolate reductase